MNGTMKIIFSLCFCVLASLQVIRAGNGYDLLPQYIVFNSSASSLPLVKNGVASPIYIDEQDWRGVQHAASDLIADVKRVSSAQAELIHSVDVSGLLNQSNGLTGTRKGIIVGTIGKSRIIDQLIAQKKLDVKDIKGTWESFVTTTIDGNLVIAGSDKRGTIYGIYDLCEKMGVSPWYWWADVPVTQQKEIYVTEGRYVMPSPKVKYRGIFINDEHPSFASWGREKFGGVNSKLYVHMFELLLRLKANYLWPAMWANAFNEDDPMNPVLADEYGIVMGTSHHEPMMRAHKEYTKRRKEVGPWDYANNRERIDQFFREGLERNKKFENIVTIGMRGDGDSPMGKGDDVENVRVLEEVIKGQRAIIEEVYQTNPAEVPQLWAIFTEVQRYYDAGFTVPEDVTLLFCDNNWGQIRRTGPKEELKRPGGMGLYYHIDMNGGPANDRWVNTTTVPKLREQLNLAYQSGIDRIWIINVGDLKPKEYPIDFIMRYAWNPDAIKVGDEASYTLAWAESIFGKNYAAEIADIVATYSNYHLTRKAEVQNPLIFSHVNFNESDRQLAQWHRLVRRAEVLEYKLPEEVRDAYYQLVLYPAKAAAGVAEMYIAAGKNNLYAKQQRLQANYWYERACVLFEQDRKMSDYYNHCVADGKWKYMMSDNHIGYISWPMPKKNELPPFQVVKPASRSSMGVALEGSEQAYPAANVATASLPLFQPIAGSDSYYIDVFNRGKGVLEGKVEAVPSESWIKVNTEKSVEGIDEIRLRVTIDWKQLPAGRHQGCVNIRHSSAVVDVMVDALNFQIPDHSQKLYGGSGEFSMMAVGYSRIHAGKYAQWVEAPGLGREQSCMLINNVLAPSATLKKGCLQKIDQLPSMEYDFFLPEPTDFKLALGILPTQDINPARGLRMAVSIDGGEPVIIDMRKNMNNIFKEYTPESLSRSKNLKPLPEVDRKFVLAGYGKPRRSDILDGLRWVDQQMDRLEAGVHTLKIIMIDPELVLEKIVVNPDNAHYSYMGKPSVEL